MDKATARMVLKHVHLHYINFNSASCSLGNCKGWIPAMTNFNPMPLLQFNIFNRYKDKMCLCTLFISYLYSNSFVLVNGVQHLNTAFFFTTEQWRSWTFHSYIKTSDDKLHHKHSRENYFIAQILLSIALIWQVSSKAVIYTSSWQNFILVTSSNSVIFIAVSD